MNGLSILVYITEGSISISFALQTWGGGIIVSVYPHVPFLVPNDALRRL